MPEQLHPRRAVCDSWLLHQVYLRRASNITESQVLHVPRVLSLGGLFDAFMYLLSTRVLVFMRPAHHVYAGSFALLVVKSWPASA